MQKIYYAKNGDESTMDKNQKLQGTNVPGDKKFGTKIPGDEMSCNL